MENCRTIEVVKTEPYLELSWYYTGKYRVAISGSTIMCRDESKIKELFSIDVKSLIEDWAVSPEGNGLIILTRDSLNEEKNDKHNLGLISWNGEISWVAETPIDLKLVNKEWVEKQVKTGNIREGYLRFWFIGNKLVAAYSASYSCEVDLKSGKLKKAEWGK